MKKILVAIDGSEPSLKAARMAVDIAKPDAAAVTLAYCIPPIVYPSEMAWVPPVEFEQQQRQAAEAVLIQAREKLVPNGVNVDRIVLRGPVAETIADEAVANRYDMVVVGSRGHGAVKRLLVGSVATRLVHICETPILVVR